MSKRTTLPTLQEGLAYTIILKDGRKISNALYYACIASGKPYFEKGNDIYPVEDVQIHSLIGRNDPDTCLDAVNSDNGRLVITRKGEFIDVYTSPNVHPKFFKLRVEDQMRSGFSQEVAEEVATGPLEMELFYDREYGAFAVEAAAVGDYKIFNPYTGKEIPNEIE